MAASSSGGVAEVPVSAKRRVASWAAPVGPAWSMIRCQTAGMALRRVAPWRFTAAQISSAPADSSRTTASRACHCWRAMVQAPMWKSG